MDQEKAQAMDAAGATVTRGGGAVEGAETHGVFEVVCRGADGRVKWRDTVKNLWTTVGKNSVLDKFLGLAAAHSAIHMGLKGTGSAVAGDTMASHGGWLEVGGTNAPAYTGNRQVPSFSAASSGSKATSSAVSYSITSSGTVAGCFIVMSGSATKDDTTGTLFSVGDFSGGSKTVSNGDTVNVTYTGSLT